MYVYKNVRPITAGKLGNLSDVVTDKGIIIDILPAGSSYEGEDMGGNILAAGYIDIHTHGGYGHDVMEGTREAIEEISRYHLSTGTTTYIPTTLTADIESTVKAIDNVRSYKETKGVARRHGVHLEGPFISLKAPGAHPPKYILNPCPDNTQWVWQNEDTVSRITVAPDNSGAVWLCEECSAHNIQVSAGHDASIDDEIYAMIDKGCSSVTHMYNCTSRPSRRTTPHKHLGLTEVGLISEKLTCEVIADNRHVPNALFSMIYKLKGRDGICLVSDSLSVAGEDYSKELYLGSGDSRQRLVVLDGVATLPELNTYAGSVTPISQMVINLHNNIGIPLEECVSMGTLVPAKLMGIKDRGDVAKGMIADFNLLDEKGNIINTILADVE